MGNYLHWHQRRFEILQAYGDAQISTQGQYHELL